MESAEGGILADTAIAVQGYATHGRWAAGRPRTIVLHGLDRCHGGVEAGRNVCGAEETIVAEKAGIGSVAWQEGGIVADAGNTNIGGQADSVRRKLVCEGWTQKEQHISVQPRVDGSIPCFCEDDLFGQLFPGFAGFPAAGPGPRDEKGYDGRFPAQTLLRLQRSIRDSSGRKIKIVMITVIMDRRADLPEIIDAAGDVALFLDIEQHHAN